MSLFCKLLADRSACWGHSVAVYGHSDGRTLCSASCRNTDLLSGLGNGFLLTV